MKSLAVLKAFSIISFSALSLNTSAALVDRGNGMIYDTTQNVTWLQDMNYAKTSGYSATGLMQWSEANTWVSQLTYGGFDDWRLPDTKQLCNCIQDISLDGSTDEGFGNNRSELAHLWHELGNTPNPSSFTLGTAGYGGSGQASAGGGIFTNFLDMTYWESGYLWTGGGYNENPNRYALDTLNGYHWDGGPFHYRLVPVVRSGDVAATAVPIPATFWLFGSALSGLGLFGRRKAVLSSKEQSTSIMQIRA